MNAAPSPPRNLGPILALIIGNMVLALGAWSVRLADCGPVSAGFWRLTLALPVLILLAWSRGQPIFSVPRPIAWALIGGGVVFAADLGAWHLGIPRTRLGNATVFGNSGAFLLMIWGLVAHRRWPRSGEWLAMAAAFIGAALLMGESFAISARTLAGDLFCILAGFFYTFYILLLRHARGATGNWTSLIWACVSGAPFLLALAMAMGEPVWPGITPGYAAHVHPAWWMHGWFPLVTLSLGSQVIGQGLLVYSLRHFSPLIIGLALLTQPAVAVVVGWLAFGETLSIVDGLGMLLVASALVLAGRSEETAPAAATPPIT